MRCEQMHELFSPYVDEMTSAKETNLMETHLQECPMCRKHVEEMRVVCTLLKNLDAPQVPANFAVDLKKNLAQEKIKIFASREVMAPKKPSWLVAGVAGIALTLGIFASSFMPMGAMVASLQTWINGDNDKSQVAVVDNDNILKQWIEKQGRNQVADNSAIDSVKKIGAKAEPTVEPSQAKPDNQSVAAPNTVPVVVKELIVENYAAKIKVEDMDNTLQALKQVADAAGAQYSNQSSNRTLVASAASTVKVVLLKVPKENVDNVLNDLVALGAGVPAKDNTDYTKAYAETEKTLIALDQDITKLRASQTNLSAEQQQQLTQLEDKQSDLLAEQQRIDKEYKLVTIEVRLVEEINP